MKIKHVTVVGAGQMGRQIALNAALHGYPVVVQDSAEAAVEAARDWADSYLDGRVEKGKLAQPAAGQAKQNLRFTTDLQAACAEADLVIEAIVEKEDIKRELFAELDRHCKPEAILASNSSFIPSSKVADATKRPDRVANLHYFNPAMVMELVEVVQGEHTGEEAVRALMEFAAAVGKQPIWLRKEIDGFAANRIIRAINKEAWFLVKNGYVTPQEVDTAVEKGLNHPMGPFRLMDMIGLDVAYFSAQRAYEQSGREEDAPSPLLVEKYEKGELGRKSGKGWYSYNQ